MTGRKPICSEMINRRRLIVLAAAATSAAPAAPAPAQRLPDWLAWKQAFLREAGRVVDTGQRGISSSESQGYGMLLAASAGDAASFDAMWAWARTHLGVRDDALLAWRWEPGPGVTDRNNAADGDLIVAWALARAGERFGRAAYTDAARRIAQDIRARLLAATPWGLVLMPALSGFDQPDGRRVNLSYWAFPAFAALDRIDPSPQWQAVTRCGLGLLQTARFGRWGLPPDWLLLVDPLVPDPARARRYGYEAARIPLYLYWARLGTAALIGPFLKFWGSFKGADFMPAWTNFGDDSIDSFGADAGTRAIARCVSTGKLPTESDPSIAEQGYYSATLGLLARLAAQEGGAA